MDTQKILTENDLKHTKQRVRVLEEIAREVTAVSQPDLEKKLGKEIDRVTLYRILNLFEEKGILHRVIDRQGTANYAVCAPNCTANHHHDEHVHFNCIVCQKIYCLPVALPKLKLPAGFTTETLNAIAYGTCDHCNKQP
ncbi:Fur family ferric uptake transcriptional regulator [Pedobacter sp. CAN_A7]|uniref:Fur family transcriptional regulator n=1 Tax=Pedobacter sp. CAN_A7 TaxID=2787722 RepID=UPI0018C8E4EC